MKVIKIVLILLFIFLGAIFCTFNRQEISLRYFGWNTGSFPLFILILVSLVGGMIVGFSVGWGERWKLRAKSREMGERVDTLQADLETLTPQRKTPEHSPAKPSEDEKPPLA